MKKLIYIGFMSLAVIILVVMAAVPHHHHHGLWCHVSHITDIYELHECDDAHCGAHDGEAAGIGLCEDGCSSTSHNDGESHSGCVEGMSYVTTKTSASAQSADIQPVLLVILPIMLSEMLKRDDISVRDYAATPPVFYNSPDVQDANGLRAPPACRA